MSSSSTSAARSVARGVLGVLVARGGLGLVGIALFGVAAIVRPGERTDTRSTVRSDERARTPRSARSETTTPAISTTHARNVERLTDTTLVADFVVAAGETYGPAGARLTEVGKDLCLIPGAEVAILNILGTDNARLGQVTLPLDSFIGFHEDDPARRAMAAAMWRTNAPMLLEQAIRKQ